ncbi:MAG: alpha/beta hydrolase [Pseudomonadota bacterium]|uniref:alpha/beta fold hydrolase n=1 Tax=Polaromonas sp. TaxID=1869339 RepID=UPI00181DF765|nr:alpha/beta hydrolase family protein [Polaromonas sp.]MBA3593252.1 alpha/beta hydrolase [Polaromonas sp.]MDQ3272137.1 alpha/beta hydrolase [Pseudomonadota bacterium]
MANFVLVHGAWHGGWCWQRVTSALQAQGHRVHAVTLTGLGERAHLLAPSITLDTHIDDVISAIEVEELHDVILVVHSYAGMIGTAVADRLGKHLKHLVYVDAVIPKPGESWSSTQSAATQQQRLSAAQSTTRFSFPPPDPEVFGLIDADHAWVKRRQTPHPGNTYQAPLDFDVKRVSAIPRTFVNCTEPALGTIEPSRLRVKDPKFWDGAWLPNSKIVEIKTGHDPMITEPAALTKILLDCAA